MRTTAYSKKLGFALALAGALAMGACSDDDEGPKSDGGSTADGSQNDGNVEADASTRAKVVTIGTTGTLLDLDPAAAVDSTTSEVLRNINYTLYVYNTETLNYDPGLAAEEPQVGGAGKEWTVKLRSGLKFADGTVCGASAIKNSIDRSIALAAAGASQLASIDNVEVVDDLTVKFTLKEASSTFLLLLSDVNLSPVNKGVYPDGKIVSSPFTEGADASDWGDTHLDQNTLDPKSLLGLGPYRLDAIEADEANKVYKSLTLKANPDFHGTKAVTETIIVKFYADEPALATALESGEVDIASGAALSSASLDKFSKDMANYELVESGGLVVQTLFLNHRFPPFNDKAVRRAVARAVDRQALKENVFPLTGRPVYSPIPEGLWPYEAVFKTEFGEQPDVEQAKTELASKDYDASNKLTFDLWYTDSDNLKEFAEQVKATLDATGVITVNLVDKGTTLFNVSGGLRDPAHTAPAFVVGWQFEVADPDDALWQLYSSTEDLVKIGYDNSAFQTLITDARNSTDFVTRRGKYEAAQPIFAQDVASVPMIQSVSLIVLRKGVEIGAPGIDGAIAFESIVKQ